MLEFKVGDRVSFQPEGHPSLVGMLTRYNKKTVTVITDEGEHWNVSPGFLRKAGAGDVNESSCIRSEGIDAAQQGAPADAGLSAAIGIDGLEPARLSLVVRRHFS